MTDGGGIIDTWIFLPLMIEEVNGIAIRNVLCKEDGKDGKKSVSSWENSNESGSEQRRNLSKYVADL